MIATAAESPRRSEVLAVAVSAGAAFVGWTVLPPPLQATAEESCAAPHFATPSDIRGSEFRARSRAQELLSGSEGFTCTSSGGTGTCLLGMDTNFLRAVVAV